MGVIRKFARAGSPAAYIGAAKGALAYLTFPLRVVGHAIRGTTSEIQNANNKRGVFLARPDLTYESVRGYRQQTMGIAALMALVFLVLGIPQIQYGMIAAAVVLALITMAFTTIAIWAFLVEIDLKKNAGE